MRGNGLDLGQLRRREIGGVEAEVNRLERDVSATRVVGILVKRNTRRRDAVLVLDVADVRTRVGDIRAIRIGIRALGRNILAGGIRVTIHVGTIRANVSGHREVIGVGTFVIVFASGYRERKNAANCDSHHHRTLHFLLLLFD